MNNVPRSPCAGFTLLELITIIAIVGILAIVAVPRLGNRDSFDSRGFYDRAAAVVRAAQKTAVAWRSTTTSGTIVFVCVTGTQVTAGTRNTCATPLVGPSGNLSFGAPPGVTLNAVIFGFDGLGRPVNSAGVTLVTTTTITFTSTIAGDPARQITVAAETGYVTAN